MFLRHKKIEKKRLIFRLFHVLFFVIVLFPGREQPWIAIMHGVLFVTVYTPKARGWVVHIVHPCTAIMYK